MTNSIHLSIATLILERSAGLRLRRFDLVRRAGFKNVAKGPGHHSLRCASRV